MKYKLKSHVKQQDLEWIGFEPNTEFDEDDQVEYITDFTYTIFSDKIKGVYFPFASIGYVTVPFSNVQLSDQILIDFNPDQKKEWDEKFGKLIDIMKDKDLIEEE